MGDTAQNARRDQDGTTRLPTIPLRGAGAWGLALALFYSVFVRFYQGAGGRVGLPGRIHESLGFQMASYRAGVLILVGGAACIVLTHASARRWPRWLPGRGGTPVPRALVTTLAAVSCAIGGVFATAHGVAGIATSLFELFGFIHIDRPLVIDPTPAVIREWDLWNILLYEPWFLAMGLALLASVRHYALATGHRRSSVRHLFGGLAALVILTSAVTIVSVSMGIIISTD